MKQIKPLNNRPISTNPNQSKNFSKSMEQQLALKSPNSNLTSLVQDLNSSLTTLQPDNSETTRLITYALIATAVVGIAVYNYIKYQETEQKNSKMLRELKKELEND